MTLTPRKLSGLSFPQLIRSSNRVGVVRIEKKESQKVLQGSEIVRIRMSTMFKGEDGYAPGVELWHRLRW